MLYPEQPPTWVLSYHRTGSSYLCDALNQTGLFRPDFNEWFLCYPFVKDRYRHLIEHPYMKMQTAQYLITFYDVPCPLEAKARIERLLPDLRYIRLRRKNLVAATASLYLAERTGIWHSTDYNPDRYAQTIVPIDRNYLYWLYLRAKRDDAFWGRFLENSPHLEVFYESLTSNKKLTIQTVFDYLNLPNPQKLFDKIAKLPKRRKMNHPQRRQLEAIIRKLIQSAMPSLL